MATHSSILAWRIPGTEEPGGLPSMGLHRVRHDWSDLAAAAVASPGNSRFPLRNYSSLNSDQWFEWDWSYSPGQRVNMWSSLASQSISFCLPQRVHKWTHDSQPIRANYEALGSISREVRSPRWCSGKKSICNVEDPRDTGLIPGLGRFPGVGNGNNSSIVVWKILWTEEPGGHRVRHYWAHTQQQLGKGNLTAMKDRSCRILEHRRRNQ